MYSRPWISAALKPTRLTPPWVFAPYRDSAWILASILEALACSSVAALAIAAVSIRRKNMKIKRFFMTIPAR
jgi:hypothetical protein